MQCLPPDVVRVVAAHLHAPHEVRLLRATCRRLCGALQPAPTTADADADAADVYLWATRHGHTALCAWLWATARVPPGRGWADGRVCAAAAAAGHLEVLRWAREHGCPWDARTCAFAASNGHLDVLRWAREHGCPWDERTCANAALNGHLEVLRWAREHGCPWDEWTCRYAAQNGHLDVLRWAIAHIAPATDAHRRLAYGDPGHRTGDLPNRAIKPTS